MSYKKKKHNAKRKNIRLLAMYRFVVVLTLVVGVSALFITLITPLIADSKQVLGTEDSREREVREGDKTNFEREKEDEWENKREWEEKEEERRREEIEKLEEMPDIEARVKESFEKVNITKKGVMTEIESREGKDFSIKSNEDGEKKELEDRTFEDIKKRLNETDIKIATDGGGFVVGGKRIGAKTNFPLSIDLSTNTLIVTTPNGQKAVGVLPDKAVENLLNKGILSKIGGGIASGSADFSTATEPEAVSFGTSSFATIQEEELQGEENIKMDVENGELVYKVEGETSQKMLGFVPVDIKKTVVVSAESGEVRSESSPILHRLLDLISL